jgi:SAM-dependent methyltransferase
VIRATSVSGGMKKFRNAQFRHFVKKYGLTGKKILEIGCGRGDYLSVMSETGAISYGLENSKSSVEYCRKNGLKAIRGFIDNESHRIKEGPFDSFYIMSFLEHLPDLRTLMSGIRNNLKKEAVGLIEVPNFDMMLRKKLYAEIIIDHLFYFTGDTLQKFLSHNGFDVLELNPVWHDFILSAVVKKRASADMKDAAFYFKKLEKDINAYVDSNRRMGGKVAIWGAGHQAFTVMSICKLTGKIEYVVDSAPFKQGKFTPATHIPIVPPDILAKKPVNAVMVMAGSYNNEIVRILKSRYKSKLRISVVENGRLKIIK